MLWRNIASARATRRGRRPWHVRTLFAREPGGLWIGLRPIRWKVLGGKGAGGLRGTKPKMASAMIETALDAGAPCAYVLGDAAYGADSSLRRMLEGRHQPYVLAVRGAHFLRRGGDRGFEETTPEELADELAPDAWARHAAGEGATRERSAALRLGPHSPPMDLERGLRALPSHSPKTINVRRAGLLSGLSIGSQY